MDDCIALARALGQRVGDELDIPVFLYERAATRPDRQNLADIRRGEFELARTEIGANPNRVPDFGPNPVHATAGATVIGARPFLVAYNVYLGGVENVPSPGTSPRRCAGRAAACATSRRSASRSTARRRSMNLVDTDKTPALPRLRTGAARSRGARSVAHPERDRRPRPGEGPLRDGGAPPAAARLLPRHRARAQGARAQGGESRAASSRRCQATRRCRAAGCRRTRRPLAAALAQMVSGLTVGRKKYAAVEAEMTALALEAVALGGRLTAARRRRR